MKFAAGKNLGTTVLGGGLVAVLAILAASTPLRGLAAQPGTVSEKVKVGLIGSMFRDVSDATVQLVLRPFSMLMREQTGLDGDLVVVPDSLELGRLLTQDKVHLAVFHGIEFAWAQHKYPELQPLCIAINRHRDLYAYLVVRNDSSIAGFADLKGKNVSLPLRSREHCHLFLQKWCAEQGVEAAAHFSQIVPHANAEAGLDDVVRGKVQAIIVDGVSLECYGLTKSGCHARLKALQRSEHFPPAVIAYHQGALDQNTLGQFRNGMINANRNVRSRIQMEMWNLTAFEPIPNNYAQCLQDVLKSYPTPDSLAARASE